MSTDEQIAYQPEGTLTELREITNGPTDAVGPFVTEVCASTHLRLGFDQDQISDNRLIERLDLGIVQRREG